MHWIDALPPKELHMTLRDNIEYLIDMEKFDARIKKEEKDKEKLKNFINNNWK